MSHVILAAGEPVAILMTIVGLGGLIFFHELGHFIACRLTGTRVEAFSVGFGKEIFGWTRGPTRYRIAIIPLGGYVKMAAENPGERGTGAPDEFPNKSFSQRLFIMSAGVLFNLILAFVLFAWAFGIGVPSPKAQIGLAMRAGPAWQAGLRPGDTVTHIDGREVLGFPDLVAEIALSDEGPVTLTVERGGRTLDIEVTPETRGGQPDIAITNAWDFAARVAPDSPVARAGGQPGDTVLAVDGEPIAAAHEIEDEFVRVAGRAPEGATELDVVLKVRRRGGTIEDLNVQLPLGDRPLLGILPFEGGRIAAVAAGTPLSPLLRRDDELLGVNGEPAPDLALLRDLPKEAPLRQLTVRRDGEEVTVAAPAGLTMADLAGAIAGQSRPGTTFVAPRPGAPAARAGLRAGDRVIRAGETAVESFEQMTKAIVRHGLEPLELVVERDGEIQVLTVMPGRWTDAPLGYESPPVMVLHREANVVHAVAMGWRQTTRFIGTIVLTVKSLLTQRVSAEQIGGPILLVQVTYRMFDQGWGLYLHILGLISVNLAILNLLPIPILDGGQILLLIAEKLRGKPLPERVVGYLQMVGLVLLLGLLILAFRNDITRLLQ